MNPADIFFFHSLRRLRNSDTYFPPIPPPIDSGELHESRTHSIDPVHGVNEPLHPVTTFRSPTSIDESETTSDGFIHEDQSHSNRFTRVPGNIVARLANTVGAAESVLRVAATGHDKRLFLKANMALEKKPVGVDRIIEEKEDMINQLPDYLLCEILLNLPTKDVIKASLLCRRWRDLWQSVLGLDLEFNGSTDFDKYDMALEKKPVGVDRIIEEKEDMINQLPDYLLCEILLNLPTKDVIKASLLCRRWRDLWQSVLGLDLEFNGSTDFDKYGFFNRFIDVKRDVCLESN
ncbi:hypothetical protein DY000_02057537 [Brassica cretica]|uniref:F-box domain-containing protein n=1 Tax=Brassica cretica TaxID=69181 RepID=A0ABQ7AF90_BRACR|nr:hypothetical protein DY000_02057537 [Brassica cretica]